MVEPVGIASKKQLGLRSLWRSSKRADPGEQSLGPNTSIFPKPSGGQDNKAQTPKDLSICVAIDTSGSTFGGGLRDEVDFLLGIDDMLSPQNRTPITVLPWSDCVGKPVTLVRRAQERPNLKSRGGTDPAVLYSSVLSLKALSSSQLWFLLTDGKIHNDFVQDFAMKSAQTGIHGIACVVVCFGSQSFIRPARCNISVGIAIFAVSPHCLFLFHDGEKLFILQAKGCFNILLPRSGDAYVQPELNDHTTWDDLPSTNFGDLARVIVPPPREVRAEEIAFQEDLNVNMQDLYAGAVNREHVGAILKNEDNRKSLVMAEVTRGHGQKLQTWLQKQHRDVPVLTKDRPDVGGKAQSGISEILRHMKRGKNPHVLDELRAQIREAHQANWKQFVIKMGEHHEEVLEAHQFNDLLRDASNRSTAMSACGDGDKYSSYAGDAFSHGKSRSRMSVSRSRLSSTRVTALREIDKHQAEVESQTTTKSHEEFSVSTEELFYPAFKRCTDTKDQDFYGSCMLCHGEAILTLLMKAPPKISTPNFPPIGSQSALAYPLAMSNFAETDFLSFFVCCDSCAVYLVRTYASPFPEVIAGAIPLVDFASNRDALLEVLMTASKSRFRKEDLTAMFLAIIDRTLVENESRTADNADKSLFRDCGQWAIKGLVEIAEVPLTLSTSFINDAGNPLGVASLASLLSDSLVLQPSDPRNAGIFLLRYPIPGFAVLLRLLQGRGTSLDYLCVLVFQRLVFHVAETFFGLSAQEGAATASLRLHTLLRDQRLDTEMIAGGCESLTNKVHLTLLQTCGLLDEETAADFQEMVGFESVNKHTEPAMAVFLHHLMRFAGLYCSPVDCFNALKSLPTMKDIMASPLAVNEALAANLIEDFGVASTLEGS